MKSIKSSKKKEGDQVDPRYEDQRAVCQNTPDSCFFFFFFLFFFFFSPLLQASHCWFTVPLSGPGEVFVGHFVSIPAGTRMRGETEPGCTTCRASSPGQMAIGGKRRTPQAQMWPRTRTHRIADDLWELKPIGREFPRPWAASQDIRWKEDRTLLATIGRAHPIAPMNGGLLVADPLGPLWKPEGPARPRGDALICFFFQGGGGKFREEMRW